MESTEHCLKTPKAELLKVVPNKAFKYLKSPLTDADNSYLFLGSENMLHQEWDWTCEWICLFQYHWYPFDTQNCYFINNVTYQPYKFKLDNVQYSGTVSLGKYYFHSIKSCELDKHGRIGMFTDFIIKRPILNNILTMFLPTAMLLIISQVSTAFSQSFKADSSKGFFGKVQEIKEMCKHLTFRYSHCMEL